MVLPGVATGDEGRQGMLLRVPYALSGTDVPRYDCYAVSGTDDGACAVLGVLDQGVSGTAVSYTHLTLPTICSV
eukprot:3161149-Rhodomonas_salina.1